MAFEYFGYIHVHVDTGQGKQFFYSVGFIKIFICYSLFICFPFSNDYFSMKISILYSK